MKLRIVKNDSDEDTVDVVMNDDDDERNIEITNDYNNDDNENTMIKTQTLTLLLGLNLIMDQKVHEVYENLKVP